MNFLVPEWPAPSNVRALATFRGSGVSAPPFDSLNLGSHVEDLPAAVAENRRLLRTVLPAEPRWLAQVHGIHVRDLDLPEDSAAADAAPADAAVTGEPGRICAILTADCLPVLLASDAGDRVGAAHAGWRGLAAGVIEATVTAMGSAPGDLLAWLGPAIGPGHFEIGVDVREALLREDPGAGGAFVLNDRGRYMADLHVLASRRLKRIGVERIHGVKACTYADSARYFSHRRDGRTGRQASLIWLESLPNR